MAKTFAAGFHQGKAFDSDVGSDVMDDGAESHADPYGSEDLEEEEEESEEEISEEEVERPKMESEEMADEYGSEEEEKEEAPAPSQRSGVADEGKIAPV